MAQITLSRYLQFINELIDESRLAEAVTHSRHLLEQHPRHIDTYRSLGKALLEQGDYAGAVDIFQRVLSAAPADFIAHVGLAIVHKAGDRWKEALWHMERAFEVEPYNAAIRTELQDLYGRRDGLAPAQVELTRGALARLYVKGGLYQQAILELRELLAADPERVDLKLLLAEAHWRAEERVEAAERGEEILALLPDCIEAHAMLADIMLVTGDAGSALPHLERLQALTQLSLATLAEQPALARLFKLPGAPALPREIRVERLSDADALGLRQQAETAAWIGELDLEAETVEDDLGWLQELEEEGVAAEPAAPGAAMPGWLTAAAAAPAQEQPEEAAPEPPAGLEEKIAESAPDWVDSVAAEEIDWSEAGGEPVEAPDWMAAGSDDLSWLEQPIEAQTPDWLAETGSPDATGETAGALGEGGAEEPALPGWLEEVQAGGAEEGQEPAAPEGTVTGDEMGEPVLEGEGLAFAESGEPEMWEEEIDREGLAMEERGNEQDEQPEAQDAEEEAQELDWLHELGKPEPTTEPGARKPEAEAGEAGELPDWLGEEGELDLDWLDEAEAGEELELAERPAREAPGEEDLSWLDQIAGGQVEPPEEMPTLEWPDEEELQLPEVPEAAAQEEPEEELPGAGNTGLDWLDALSSEDDAVTASWLGGLTGAAEEGDEPQLFSEEIGDLDWLEETAEQPGAGDAVAAFEGEDESLDWLGDGEAPPEAEAAAADIFAAEEEAEPVLDWLEAGPEVGEEAVEATPEAEDAGEEPFVPADLEEAMAWLDEIPGAADAGGAGDVPEDLDEAMAWLEQLAAQQGAPLEELPSIAAPEGPAGEGGEVAEPAEAVIFDEMPELALPEEETPEPNLEWMEALAEVEATEAELPAASEDEFEAPADLDEAMAWLEGLADEEETGAGELPEWLREEAEFGEAVEGEEEEAAETLADVPEELDEALAWLEQLAAQQDAPAQEALPEASEEAAPEMAVTPEMETPPAMQVPDAAMMYLDSLLLGGGQPAGEDARGPVQELAEELPDDPDSALVWLEQLATQTPAETTAAGEPEAAEAPGISPDWLDELGAGPEEAVEVVEEVVYEEWQWTEQLPEPQQWEEAEPEAELPEEPPAEEAEGEAWAWTEQLPEPEQWEEEGPEAGLPVETEAEEAEAGEWAWTEQLPELEQWEEDEPSPEELADELLAAVPAPEEMFDDIPEDPDEAMAWLERLAARQGAPLDELPSVDEVSEEVETPAWLAREMADAETAAPEPPEPESVSEELDWLEAAENLEWLEDGGAEERPAEPGLPEAAEGEADLAEMEAAFDLDILQGEEMEPALPEWLAGEDESWPGELTDIDSWLVAEEEASRIGLQVPEPERPAPRAAGPAPRPEPAPAERIAPPEGTDAARLEAARAALDGGDVDAAIAAYHDYMRGGGLNVVIADLEMETAANEQPMLLRLLGDAYMENGQLTRALDAYRRALDLL